MDTRKFRNNKLGIAGGLIALTAFAITANVIPPLETTIAPDIGVEYESFGNLFMLQFLFFCVAGFTGGWVISKFGWTARGLVILGFALCSICLVIGGQLNSLISFVIWAIPIGYAGGLIETFSSVMLTAHEKQNSSKLINLSQVFFCAGAVGAPMLVSTGLSLDISWRVLITALGIAVGFLGILFCFWTRMQSEDDESIKLKEKQEHQESKVKLMTDIEFWLLSVFLFLYVAIEGSIVCWVSAYFEKYLLMSPELAARRLSYFWLGIMGGRLTMLVLPTRWTLFPALFVSMVLIIITTAAMSIKFQPMLATAVIFLTGLAYGPIWPTTVAASRYIRTSAKFTAGVIAIGALGAATGPFLAGMLIKYAGPQWLFPVLTAGCIVQLCVLWMAWQKNQKFSDPQYHSKRL